MNSVVLHGTVSLAPKQQTNANGTASVYFGLELKELMRKTGKTISTYIDVVVYGDTMRTAESLGKGDSVLLHGKLMGRKKQDVHTLAVMATQLTVLQQASAGFGEGVQNELKSMTLPTDFPEQDVPF